MMGAADPDEPVTPHIREAANVGVTKQKLLNRSSKVRPALNGAVGESASLEVDKGEPTMQRPADAGNSAPIEKSIEHERNKDELKASGRPRPTKLAEFIKAAYMTTSKFGLTAADIDVLEASLAVDDSRTVERDLVLELAVDDLTLRGLVNLLSPVSQLTPRKSRLRDRISHLATAALWQHPLYKNFHARPRTAAGLPDISAKRLWDSAPDVAKGLGQSESRSKSLRTNGVTAFVLLRVIHDDWTLKEIVGALGETLWASQPESSSRSVVAAAILLGAGDYDLSVRLGVLHEWAALATREAEKQRSAASVAAMANSRKASEAEARVVSLESDVEALESELAERREQLRRASAQLQTEQERSSVARSHHADDYEVLRTQIIRQLSKQTDLLADGLHALRNGSHGIAEEFVDRALTAITREVGILKKNGDHQ